jgi:hypothetical protein
MLLKQRTLTGIREGRITLAFRRWQRPSVKAGGTLLTPVGQLAIRRVTETTAADITERQAVRAGFATRDELLQELNQRRGGAIYRIEFQLAGPDPRIALRENDSLSDEQFQELSARLKRLDERSSIGPWTRKVLTLIAAHPERRAGDLAETGGYEKAAFKLNVRKLKNLGLTESLGVGYRLSPRGEAYLARSA